MSQGKESSAQAAEETEVAVTKAVKREIVTVYDVYWLGITIVIGGQMTGWNTALGQGYTQTFIGMLVVALGYFCLVFCIAEMTSILTFAGGSYGFTRAVLGPVTGYFVGVCESLEYILYVAAAAVSFELLCADLFHYESTAVKPLYYLLLYAITLPFHLYGGHIFWVYSTVLGIVSLIVIVLYCLALIPHADFAEEHNHSPDFTDGKGFMYHLNKLAWLFVGIESMTLGNNNIKDAGNKVPFAMVACMCTLFVTTVCIFLVIGSTDPGIGILAGEDHVMDPGLGLALKTSHQTSSILLIPGFVATAYGFQFAYTKQINAMANSGLVPKIFAYTYGPNDAPMAACMAGSVLSLALLLACYDTVENFSAKMFDIVICGACCVYINLFRSYLICHSRYSNMERSFRSPLGVYGAYIGMAVFSLMLIGVAFFNRDNGISISVFVIVMIFAMAYYFLVAQKREFFSKEEQEKFMKAYILNSNHKNKKNRSKSKGSSASASGLFKGLNKVLPSSMQLGKSAAKVGGNSMAKSSSNANSAVSFSKGDGQSHLSGNSSGSRAK
eukprot:gene25428-30703_t